jgi:membrane peptidoglycan carboxypeptidase
MFAKVSKKRQRSGAAGGIAAFVGMSAIAAVLVASSVTPAIAVAGLTANSTLGIFDNLPTYLEIGDLAQKSTIYATGPDDQPVVLATFYAQNREDVTLANVSPFIKNAAIASEDPRFFEHGGVDLFGTVRALLSNALTGSSQGGSSITQQYVKNVLVQKAEDLADPVERKAAYEEATQVSVDRKLKEMKLAVDVEQKYTKNQILEGYLNITPYGGRVYGVQAAARYYFGKSAKDVTLAEAATLIAIINNPSAYRPDIEENEEDNTDRRNYILASMLENGKVTQKQYDTAVKTPLKLNITEASTGCQTAPDGAAYFCDYITWVIKNDKAFGETEDERWNAFQRGGWKIYSSLSVPLQQTASQAINSNVPTVVDWGNIAGAAVSVQVNTGRILAMAQSKDYTNDPDLAASGGNFTSINYSTDKAYGGSSGFQAASTYKAFTLAQWLKSGRGLSEMVDPRVRPLPMNKFSDKCQGVGGADWNPRNDSGTFTGPVSVTAATSDSINLAYISMAMKLDLCDIKQTAEAFGVHRADGNVLGQAPSDILGTQEVSPLTMATAYAGMANQGRVCTPIAIDKIVDQNGVEIPAPKTTCTQAVTPEVANAMVVALKTPITGGTATASNPRDGVPIIGKTGSNDNYNQTWIVASTTSVSTAVWVGNTVGFTSLTGRSLSTGAATTARHRIMNPIMATANALFGGAQWASPPANLLGGRNAVIPDVSGLSLEDGVKLLESVDLAVDGSCGTIDGREANGRIESTVPAAGTTLPTGTVVNICLSNGMLVTGPPSVIGQTEAAGQSFLLSKGWKVRITYASAPTCPGEDAGDDEPAPTPAPTAEPCPNPNQGKIIRQTPNGGFARPGSTVTITVQR